MAAPLLRKRTASITARRAAEIAAKRPVERSAIDDAPGDEPFGPTLRVRVWLGERGRQFCDLCKGKAGARPVRFYAPLDATCDGCGWPFVEPGL